MPRERRQASRRPWFLVTCRIEYDNEDTVVITRARTAAAAIAEAEKKLREEAGGEVEAHAERVPFYWNYCIESATQPEIVMSNV